MADNELNEIKQKLERIEHKLDRVLILETDMQWVKGSIKYSVLLFITAVGSAAAYIFTN
jgi:hypothetical protein